MNLKRQVWLGRLDPAVVKNNKDDDLRQMSVCLKNRYALRPKVTLDKHVVRKPACLST